MTAVKNSTHQLKTGDAIVVTVDGRDYDMTVYQTSPAGTMGRSRIAGPLVYATLSSGNGYAVSFDDSTRSMTWRRKETK